MFWEKKSKTMIKSLVRCSIVLTKANSNRSVNWGGGHSKLTVSVNLTIFVYYYAVKFAVFYQKPAVTGCGEYYAQKVRFHTHLE
jgi:hypothetical protein